MKKIVIFAFLLLIQNMKCVDRNPYILPGHPRTEEELIEKARQSKRSAFQEIVLGIPAYMGWGVLKQMAYAPTYIGVCRVFSFYYDNKLNNKRYLTPLFLPMLYALKKGNDYFWYGPNSTFKSRSVLMEGGRQLKKRIEIIRK